MHDSVQHLMDARDKLIDGFVQGYYAVDGDGQSVSIMSPDAKRFCSLGALAVTTSQEELRFHPAYGGYSASALQRSSTCPCRNFLTEAIYEAGWRATEELDPIIGYTDDNNKEDVIAVFDQAIRKAKEAANSGTP